MSFDNEVLHMVYLVTFPSVWLPPPRTSRKLLLLGANVENVHMVSDMVGERFLNTDWALYYVPDFDITNKEHLDWILINHVIVDATLAFPHRLDDFVLAQSLNCRVIAQDYPYHVSQLLDFGGVDPVDLATALTSIVPDFEEGAASK